MEEPTEITTSYNDAPSAAVPTPVSRIAAAGSPPAETSPSPVRPARPAERPENRDDCAYIPAFVAMLVLAAAERYLAACLLIKLGMESSLVFLLEPNICMDTLISGLEDFVPFEFKNNSHCFYGMKYGRNW